MARVLCIYRESGETEPYAEALRAAGLEPVFTSTGNAGVLPNELDGLLLMGGSDVDPALYGERRAPETEDPDRELDAAECAAISEAIGRDLPVLGICRGLQILNVQQGGALIQHLPNHERHRVRPRDLSLPAHGVRILPDTLLASIAAPASSWRVNSRHHQGIARLAGSLRISAVDDEDGTVEAVERPASRFVLAVQWHPENQAPVNAQQAKLFEAFGDACSRRGSQG